MVKRIAAVLALTGAAFIALHGAPASANPRPARHAVLIGVPGLQWSDVGPSVTPHLWRLAQDGATGLLSVRAVGRLTCPADGWVTVSAGVRSAAGPYCGRPVTVTPAGSGAVVG